MKQMVSDMIEGQKAFTRFDTTVKTLLSVPRAVLSTREAEYKKQAALKPKRGPKPKIKPDASRALGA
jgi:hypothetical protein